MPRLLVSGQPAPVEVLRTALDPKDVARVLGVESRYVRNMLRRGELTNVSADNRRRVDPAQPLDVIDAGIIAERFMPSSRLRFAQLVSTPASKPWRPAT